MNRLNWILYPIDRKMAQVMTHFAQKDANRKSPTNSTPQSQKTKGIQALAYEI